MGSPKLTGDPAGPRTRVTPTKVDKRGTRYEDVRTVEDDRLLVRIAHYHDLQVTEPKGFEQGLALVNAFPALQEKHGFQSLAFDSVTFASLLARKWHEHDLNKNAKDPRQWYGGAVDLIEELLCIQLPALQCHVGVAMHISKTKIETEGSMVRAPLAPGRLLNMIAAAWPEVYHLYVERDEDGNRVRRLQTESDALWQAGTCIGAPDGCKARWESIWKSYPGDDRPLWHGIVYGEPHAGKTTFLATMPTPIYAAVFDAQGKDVPYRLVQP